MNSIHPTNPAAAINTGPPRHECNVAHVAMRALICLFLMAALPGCSLLRAPTKAVEAITPGNKPPKVDPAEASTHVQQLADEYTLRTVQALDKYAAIIGTPQASSQALRWKLVTTTYAMRIAGGYNPYGNLVDLVAMITLNRNALEAYWSHTPQAAAFQPWLEACRILDTNVWNVANVTFSADQTKKLHEAIDNYVKEHAAADYPLFTRSLDFGTSFKLMTSQDEGQSSILGFVGLDPTMGLDPAVQEVTRARMFAERAMFTVQRMPSLLRLQTEVLTDELLQRPEFQQTLTNTTSLTESVDRISHVTETLPDRLSAERAAIINALDQQEGKLRDLSAEVGRSLTAAGKMSDSLTVTITNFDALMKRFGVGEPSTNKVASTNSQPFKILDYAETASSIGEAAHELNGLVVGISQATPRVDELSAHTTANIRNLINHAFVLGLILIIVLLAGSVAAALFYRLIARKISEPGPTPELTPKP